MRTRFWFELTATIVIGIVVLALLGPIPVVVYAIAAVGFMGRSGARYHRSISHHHRRHH